MIIIIGDMVRCQTVERDQIDSVLSLGATYKVFNREIWPCGCRMVDIGIDTRPVLSISRCKHRQLKSYKQLFESDKFTVYSKFGEDSQ